MLNSVECGHFWDIHGPEKLTCGKSLNFVQRKIERTSKEGGEGTHVLRCVNHLSHSIAAHSYLR